MPEKDKGVLDNAYINNSMPAWKVIVDQLQNKKEKSNDQVLELINYQYGYIGFIAPSTTQTQDIKWPTSSGFGPAKVDPAKVESAPRVITTTKLRT